MRSPIVQEFKPDLVLTLIDDVYDMWWRTEHRARGEKRKGRPTLEQLLTARRFEQALGSQLTGVLNRHGQRPSVRHCLVPVKHPVDVLARLICLAPQVVYLSFPISEPRRMAARGDRTGINEINSFLQHVYDFQSRRTEVVFLNPLAIDELPLVRAWEKVEKECGQRGEDRPQELPFNRGLERWDMGAFSDDARLLTAESKPPVDQDIVLSFEQLKDAVGLMASDVGWRDYRLVGQAHALAVYNGVFNNSDHAARGVKGEINTAGKLQVPVYWLQHEQHDKAGRFQDFMEGGGRTGDSVVDFGRHRCHSVDELLERVSQRA